MALEGPCIHARPRTYTAGRKADGINIPLIYVVARPEMFLAGDSSLE